MTYLFDCTTRNAAIGNFNIQELLLDPRTMFKAWLIQSLPFGNRTVFRNTSMDRLERWDIWNKPSFWLTFIQLHASFLLPPRISSSDGLPLFRIIFPTLARLFLLPRDSISDMTDGYPDMAEELGVKLQRVTDRFPWEVTCTLHPVSHAQHIVPCTGAPRLLGHLHCRGHCPPAGEVAPVKPSGPLLRKQTYIILLFY